MKKKYEIFSEWINIVVVPKAGAFAQNRYIQSITRGLLSYMPFTIIASVFMMISWLPIPGYEEFVNNLFNVSNATIWRSQLGVVSNASLDIGGIIVILGITKNLSSYYKLDTLQTQLTALVSFLVLTKYMVDDTGSYIPVAKVGAQSMFLVIIIAIATVELYKYIDKKGLTIKMPASVPPAVGKPFESIIPSFFVIVVAFALRQFLDLVLQTDLISLVTSVISKPLMSLGGTLPGTIIAVIVAQFFWFFGIHGGDIVGSVMNPLWLVMQDENRLASLAGLVPPNIVNYGFIYFFVHVGTNLGAIIAVLLIGRSIRYREIGKLSLGPGIFNIGEPYAFGLPVMLNIVYLIPYIFSSVLGALISYAAFSLKLVPIPTGLAQLSWTTPPIISGFLITGSIKGAILQIVIILAVLALWIPFVKIGDGMALKDEKVKE